MFSPIYFDHGALAQQYKPLSTREASCSVSYLVPNSLT